MAFIEDTDKYQKWRYNINELYILYPDGSQTSIPPNRIVNIEMVHLFEENLFPIFKINLVLASYTYYKIIKNKKNIKFKIRIQKYYSDIDSSKKSLNRDWINDTFDLILDDDDYDSEESIRKEEKNLDYNTTINNTNENDIFDVDNTMEFFLFKSDLIDKFNININAVLSNATVNDAIQYIASCIGLDNLLMTPPHNHTNIKELILPPLKASQNIKFLDTYYGIYKTGMLFYSDMISNITYLIDYSPKCTAYQNNELKETHILMPKKSNKYASDFCSLKRKNNQETYFIIGDSKNMSIRNESISYNAYAATNAKIIDTYDGTVVSSNDTSTKEGHSVKIIENNTENPWYSDIYNSIISGKNIVIEMVLANYDISAIAPNKTYKIVFEDGAMASKYRGNLIISSVTHSLSREGESFTLSSIVKFRLI